MMNRFYNLKEIENYLISLKDDLILDIKKLETKRRKIEKQIRGQEVKQNILDNSIHGLLKNITLSAKLPTDDTSPLTPELRLKINDNRLGFKRRCVWKLSAAICQIRSVRKGKSNKSVMDILWKIQ